MRASSLQVSEKVRRKAESLGERGRAWLNDLPGYIGEIESAWKIAVGQPFSSGTEAFTAAARTEGGKSLVLKIVIPGVDPTRQELRILRAAKGKGYAHLIAADETANAILLERLGSQLHEHALAADTQLEKICLTLRLAWLRPSDAETFVTGAERAAQLARFIEDNWSTLGKPCTERTIELALTYAERRRRAFDPTRSVLVHGDAHQWNTLRATDSATGFKFIDPDGAFAEPAFDLAIPMREWGQRVPDGDLVQLGRHRCRLLAELTGVEEQPIWEWSLIQCVSNGLSLQQIGFGEVAAVEFAMADAWTAGSGSLLPRR